MNFRRMPRKMLSFLYKKAQRVLSQLKNYIGTNGDLYIIQVLFQVLFECSLEQFFNLELFYDTLYNTMRKGGLLLWLRKNERLLNTEDR